MLGFGDEGRGDLNMVYEFVGENVRCGQNEVFEIGAEGIGELNWMDEFDDEGGGWDGPNKVEEFGSGGGG